MPAEQVNMVKLYFASRQRRIDLAHREDRTDGRICQSVKRDEYLVADSDTSTQLAGIFASSSFVGMVFQGTEPEAPL